MVEVPKLDVIGMVSQLAASNVRYILIGGIAAQTMDLPVPATIDLDITPMRTQGNLRNLSHFFSATDTALMTADDGGTWFPHHLIGNWAQYDTLHLINRYGLLDIVFRPEGASNGYEDLIGASSKNQIGEQKIQIITEEQWVELKTASGREKDLEHLAMYFNKKHGRR